MLLSLCSHSRDTSFGSKSLIVFRAISGNVHLIMSINIYMKCFSGVFGYDRFMNDVMSQLFVKCVCHTLFGVLTPVLISTNITEITNRIPCILDVGRRHIHIQ